MYSNKESSRVNQLQPDIGRNIPQEKLKLGKKMKSGGTALDISNKIRDIDNQFKILKENALPDIRNMPQKDWETQRDALLDQEKKLLKQLKAARAEEDRQFRKKFGKKTKKYSYRRGGTATLRKPKRGK